MTITGLIERLQNAITHGQNPEAKILAWDPESENWEEITGFTLSPEFVHIYTDEF